MDVPAEAFFTLTQIKIEDQIPEDFGQWLVFFSPENKDPVNVYI